MRSSLAEQLRCPACNASGAFRVRGDVVDRSEVKDGYLICGHCARDYAIRNFVPRFVGDKNYARSFGFQWNKHATTQIDRANGNELSRRRFFAATAWPEVMRGQKLLEAGSGAGRFTAIAADTGADVFSFDYSNAVDANLANNGRRENVHLLQADIVNIPLPRRFFDRVLCLGVLQHCPDPWIAFQSLVTHLAPGGQIVIDVYSLKWRTLFHPKYWLRPITTRMSEERLHKRVTWAVPKLLPLKRWLTDRVTLGRYLAYSLPVAYQHEWRELANEHGAAYIEELSILDTFDWYSPAHDHPQTLSRVRQWFKSAGLENVSVAYGPNGIVGRGSQPS